MSIALMSRVWKLQTETPAEKLILLFLADKADDDGRNIYPSKPTVAKGCGLDVRTVQRIMSKLEEQGGLVLVAARVGTPTVYRLDMDTLNRRSDTPAECHPPASDTVTPGNASEAPPAPDTPPPGARPVNPSTNHQLEPPMEPSEAAAPTLHPSVKDWPVIHAVDGDFVVPHPYASCEPIELALKDWVGMRMASKGKKERLTAYALKLNTKWWDRYPLGAVIEAVERSAARQYRGIIEDVARDWKPTQAAQASIIQSSGVLNSVQRMASTMETRQLMIREAAARAAEHGPGMNGQAQGALAAVNE